MSAINEHSGILSRLIGRYRLFFGHCPRCNGDAPAVDNCHVCDGIHANEGYWLEWNQRQQFPPNRVTKARWWLLFVGTITTPGYYHIHGPKLVPEVELPEWKRKRIDIDECIEPGCAARKPEKPQRVPGPPDTPMRYVCPEHARKWRRDSTGRLFIRPDLDAAPPQPGRWNA